jgi:diguanylate cyclase (GGDEF)-like protein
MRILLADDEPTLRNVITQVLVGDGHEVTAASSAEEALEHFRKKPFPLVVTDIVMGRMSGLELLKETRLIDPETLVVVMTSHASLETAISALRDGAHDYLVKPFEELDVISAVVNRAIDKILLQADLKRKTLELEALNRTLREMADRDGLTNLHNHRFFREALEREIARSSRHGRTFSLILMDLDRFKLYNDTHGHLAGDSALRSIGSILRGTCRASTVAARYGGEEFIVLAPETDAEHARLYAEALRQRVEKTRFEAREPGDSVSLTLSIGVATFPQDGKDAEALIGQADKALYRAKAGGRNRIG